VEQNTQVERRSSGVQRPELYRPFRKFKRFVRILSMTCPQVIPVLDEDGCHAINGNNVLKKLGEKHRQLRVDIKAQNLPLVPHGDVKQDAQGGRSTCPLSLKPIPLTSSHTQLHTQTRRKRRRSEAESEQKRPRKDKLRDPDLSHESKMPKSRDKLKIPAAVTYVEDEDSDSDMPSLPEAHIVAKTDKPTSAPPAYTSLCFVVFRVDVCATDETENNIFIFFRALRPTQMCY